MKVSDLKLKTVYIGRGGKERLLVDRSQNSAVITQKDSDLVEYRVVENGIVSNQKCIITTRAFARWAVTEKVHKVTITTGNIFYLGNEKVVVSFVYSMFNLVRVHYVDNNQEFVVDAAALSETPDETSTINLALFTERGRESPLRELWEYVNKKEPSNE